ncbi:hypothetical protein C9374_004379 [Naegleria lovaniensis]|uniref:Uncharacterized protein n=1 Tax=Naegleria lovaniensis TaxID=51637 RepID=A0AA88GSL9_NAELO|nr:uncharacterized protein C9374_004379 [Naegleria lovaniensis]KAG2383708.1 hypothetical protein C9374_004379 [Naegleria lovaniensis]
MMTTMNPRSASSSHRTPKELECIHHDEDDLTSNCSDLALSDNEQNKAISLPRTIQRQHQDMNKDGKSTQDSQGSLTSGISTAMHLSAISKEATTQFVPEKEHELFFNSAQQLEDALSGDEYLAQVSIQSEKLSLQDEDLHAQLELGSLFVANDHNSSNYQMETIDTTKNEIINNSHTLCDATENASVSCSYEETTSAEYSSVNTECEEPHKQCLKTEQKIEPTLVDEVEQQSIENVAAFSHQTQEYALSPQPQYVNISTNLQLENILLTLMWQPFPNENWKP